MRSPKEKSFEVYFDVYLKIKGDFVIFALGLRV